MLRLSNSVVSKNSSKLPSIGPLTKTTKYGQSSAPYQHFGMAAMRAIEQGRYLARAANTGISGIVDPYGRVSERSAIFEQAGLVGTIRFLNGRTVYSRLGDVTPWGAIGLMAVAMVGARLTSRRGAPRGR